MAQGCRDSRDLPMIDEANGSCKIVATLCTAAPARSYILCRGGPSREVGLGRCRDRLSLQGSGWAITYTPSPCFAKEWPHICTIGARSHYSWCVYPTVRLHFLLSHMQLHLHTLHFETIYAGADVSSFMARCADRICTVHVDDGNASHGASNRFHSIPFRWTRFHSTQLNPI